MTDKKNIKALEDYIKENEFEYFHSNMMNEYPLIRKSLDIINRQKAEIEKLQKEVSVARDAYISIQDRYEHTKIEACKEFANKLEEKCGIFTPLGVNWIEEVKAVRVSDIDKILKEIVGEKE